MSRDDTDRTDPISRVNSRLIPVQRVRQAQAVSVDVRVNQARRTFLSLSTAAIDPPLTQRVEFVISDLGNLKTNTLTHFQLTNDDEGDRLGFTLAFEYRGQAQLKHRCESELVHNKLRKTLIGLGLNFRAVSSATINRLEIDAVVPAFVSISASEGSRYAAVCLSNVAILGAATYEVPVEALDRKLVDALVELISTGKRDFYQLIARSGARRD